MDLQMDKIQEEMRDLSLLLRALRKTRLIGLKYAGKAREEDVPTGYYTDAELALVRASGPSDAERLAAETLPLPTLLRDELAYWRARRAGTLDEHVGKFMVVVKEDLSGPYATLPDAVAFLVQQRHQGFVTCVGGEDA